MAERTVYVSESGLDTNDGSEGAPLKNVLAALHALTCDEKGVPKVSLSCQSKICIGYLRAASWLFPKRKARNGLQLPKLS